MRAMFKPEEIMCVYMALHAGNKGQKLFVGLETLETEIL